MRTKWIYTMFVLALSLFTSCNNEVDEAAGNKKTRTVVFRLSVDDAVGSRAAWGDSYDVGNADVPFDTRINLDGLQVVVYDANNRYVGKAKNVLYWQVSGNENDNAKEEYEFVGDLSHLEFTEDANYKLMLFANCPEVGENTAVNDLYFDIDDESLAYPNGAIPMWGLKQMTIGGTSDLIDLGVIDLLRAIAKVEVVLDPSLQSTYSLSAVTANVHNEYGYCVPSGWNAQGVTETKHLDQEISFHPYRSVRQTSLAAKNNNAEKYFIYLTEFDHTAFENLYDTKLSVTLNGLPEFKDAISFTELNIPYIVRNHIYRFTIKGIREGGLELAYEVADWARTDNWLWTQDFSYPTYHNPVLPDDALRDNNPTNDTYPEYPKMSYNNQNSDNDIKTTEGAFSCWFQLTAPAEQSWRPVLREGVTECEIHVYNDNNPQELLYTTETREEISADVRNGSKLKAYSGWYNIKVIPTKAEYTGFATLGITYTQSWMGSNGIRYLLINGEADKIVWPNSGSEARLIKITQESN